MRRLAVRGILICGFLLLGVVVGGSGLLQGDPYEPNDTLEEATPIELPFHAEDLTIFPPGDRDFFSFELEEAALVDIDVDADELGSPLDSVLHLLDAAGREIGFSDDYDGYDPHIVQLLEPGRYFVAVRGYGRGSTGPYNLEIEALVFQEDPYEPNDTLEEATPIELPFHVEGLTIFPPGDRDLFSFELEEAALVDIDVDADELGSPLDSVLHLLDAAGEEIDFSDDYDGYDPRIIRSLEPGRYFVAVRGYSSDSVGSYNLEIEALVFQEDPCEPNDTLEEATPIELPFHVEGLTIFPPGDRDLFSFELEEAALVDIDVDADELGSPLNGVLQVLDANGEEITFSDDYDGYDPHSIPLLEPGLYFVAVRGSEDQSVGSYDLHIEITATGQLACMEGQLSPGGSALWNLGTLRPGTRVMVSLAGPETADFDLYLHEIISEAPLLTVTVARGLSLTSQEFIEYEVQGSVPKKYIAEVYAYDGEGAYRLCWFRFAP